MYAYSILQSLNLNLGTKTPFLEFPTKIFEFYVLKCIYTLIFRSIAFKMAIPQNGTDTQTHTTHTHTHTHTHRRFWGDYIEVLSRIFLGGFHSTSAALR